MRHLLATALLLCCLTPLRAEQRISLDGAGWTFQPTLEKPQPVTVPHCWPASETYRKYIGHALYERNFEAPPVRAGQVVRLHFDAVYDVAQVWVNGRRVGEHHGGYTPFEFDVTSLLHPGQNHLLLDVDNTPTITSIPALATGTPSTQQSPVEGGAGRTTIVGWMPYGGIVRPVSLLVTDAVYLRNIKIDSRPDLRTGTASITAHAWLHNAGAATIVTATGRIAGIEVKFPRTRVAARSDAEVTWTGSLPNAHLWSVRDPFLYDARIDVGSDGKTAKIGIRDVRVVGTQLLLNGRPVHLYGANRVSEDPQLGLLETDATLERDLSDMIADNMRMMRIAHYPEPPYLLDFADKHGMLLIPEAGNWNFSGWQMADPGIRATFQQQQREMIEQDWNHPSVIAWSVGNEYESYKPEGIAWTRDMRAFTLGVDSTRLITFADRYTSDPYVKTGTDDASQYSDFVSINVYGNYARRFDRAHELYPDKPVFVTEFGKTGEPGLHDPLRTADITEAVEAIRQRPWMIGASLWTWADYRSLIAGTPETGIRSWGTVTLNREHRDSWAVVQKLFQTELP